jgi:hypothetical protein
MPSAGLAAAGRARLFELLELILDKRILFFYIIEVFVNDSEVVMKLLSRQEEIVLPSIWHLKGNASGVTIREHISELTGKYRPGTYEGD